MKKKTKGGIVYNFDITTIGKISVEREYNKSLVLDRDGMELMAEINGFAHSLDFVSINSIFEKPNGYIFLIKEYIPDIEKYFINNLKKTICGKKEFITLLVDIYSDETFDLSDVSVDTISFVKLSDSMKKLADFILFDDYSVVEGEQVIESGLNETKEFLRNIKSIYGENYKKAKQGGVGSEEHSLTYTNTSDYVPIVSFKSYSEIKKYLSMHISAEFFDNLTIVIGFANVFRFCGLFGNRTNAYKYLNNLYHLLEYYPFYGSIEDKNQFIIDVYKDAHFVLLEVAKKLYSVCTGNNLNRTEVKLRSKSLSEAASTSETSLRPEVASTSETSLRPEAASISETSLRPEAASTSETSLRQRTQERRSTRIASKNN